MNKKMRIVLIVLFSAIVFTIICFIGFVWLNKKKEFSGRKISTRVTFTTGANENFFK